MRVECLRGLCVSLCVDVTSECLSFTWLSRYICPVTLFAILSCCCFSSLRLLCSTCRELSRASSSSCSTTHTHKTNPSEFLPCPPAAPSDVYVSVCLNKTYNIDVFPFIHWSGAGFCFCSLVRFFLFSPSLFVLFFV